MSEAYSTQAKTSSSNRLFSNCREMTVSHPSIDTGRSPARSPSRLAVSPVLASRRTSPTPSVSPMSLNTSDAPSRRRDSQTSTLLSRGSPELSVYKTSARPTSPALPSPVKEKKCRYFVQPSHSSGPEISIQGETVPLWMPEGTRLPELIAFDEKEPPYGDNAELTPAEQQHLDRTFPEHDGYQIDPEGVSHSCVDVTLVYPAETFGSRVRSGAHATLRTPTGEGSAGDSSRDIVKIRNARVVTILDPSPRYDIKGVSFSDCYSGWLSIMPSDGPLQFDPESAEGRKESQETRRSQRLDDPDMLGAIHRGTQSAESSLVKVKDAGRETIPVSKFGIVEQSPGGELPQPTVHTSFVPREEVVFYGMVNRRDDQAFDATTSAAGDYLLLRKEKDDEGYRWYDRARRSRSPSPN